MAFSIKKAHPNTIKLVANWYVRYKESSFDSIAARLQVTARSVSGLLFRGIAEDILSDEVSDKIFAKVVYCYKEGQIQRRNRWEEAFELREEKRSNDRKTTKRRSYYEARIAEVEHKIASYDDYFIEEEGAPTIADLTKELVALKAHCY